MVIVSLISRCQLYTDSVLYWLIFLSLKNVPDNYVYMFIYLSLHT